MSSMVSSSLLAVASSAVAMAKSLTCRMNITRWPSMMPEYRQGSWAVGVRPICRRMGSACFSHSRGDSGWPCIAEFTGITWPGGMGGRFLWRVHQSWKALSGFI